jgi:hypothetical protein
VRLKRPQLRRKEEGRRPGSSAGRSGKGKEKRAEKEDGSGVVRCKRLARIWGILALQQVHGAETRDAAR